MQVKKITPGFVIQTFDTETGKWVSQEFIASDETVYENADSEQFDEDGGDLEGADESYLPFYMVQPS